MMLRAVSLLPSGKPKLKKMSPAITVSVIWTDFFPGDGHPADVDGQYVSNFTPSKVIEPFRK
jgi:hypothetical protein